MDYTGSWDTHRLLIELAYNNNYHSSFEKAPCEALYGRRGRFSIRWNEVGGSNDRQESYADNRRESLAFQEGEHVFVNVSPMSNVIRFGRRGKSSSRYVRPSQILDRLELQRIVPRYSQHMQGFTMFFTSHNSGSTLPIYHM